MSQMNLLTFVKTGIQREPTISYTPQQNGVAERVNPGMLLSFRAEAISTAVHVRNRSPRVQLNGVTPYERWYNK